MEKTYKRVSFDIELAKKIQSKEVEGRIVTANGLNVRILCFDKKPSNDIVALVTTTNNHEELCGLYNKYGILLECRVDYTGGLRIELPEETQKHDSFNKKLHDTAEVLATPKHEFKPFDKVLVRMCDEEVWRVRIYGFKCEDGTHSCINTSCWEQCIPYEGNEHLVGTTNNPNSPIIIGDKTFYLDEEDEDKMIDWRKKFCL